MSDSAQTMSELIKEAERQGWRVDTANGKHRFYSPIGTIVLAHQMNGHADRGRSMQNLRSELKRAGLNLNGPVKSRRKDTPEMAANTNGAAPAAGAPEPTVDTVLGYTPSTVEDALEAVIQMVEELADDYATFRKHVQTELVELRGELKQFGLNAIDKASAERYATTEQLAEAVRRLERSMTATAAALDERLAEQAAKADPIAAFRARLSR